MLVHKYGILYHCPTSGRTMVHSIKFSCSNTRPEDFLGLICFVIDTEIFVVYQMTRKYSTIDLQNAIDEVRSGAGVRTTERKYGIPHGTFMDKLHGKTSVNVRKGPSTILTNAEEELLVLWLKAMAKKGIPVSVRQVQDAVQQIIQEDNRKTSFTNDRPGRKWVQLFFMRHPDVSLRKAEVIGVPRALVTERAIRKWHGDLYKYVIEEVGDPDLLMDPTRILNGDETAFQTNPTTSTVIGPTGFKNLYEVKGKDKECITVLATFLASGEMTPPCVVYPYERIPSEIARNINPSWSLGKSEKGWMTAKVFFGYIANTLLPYLKERNTKFPILFLIDGHKSHLSYEVANLCKENKIILYSLLPNATHILQPADVSVFKPVKTQWRKIVEDWKLKSGQRTVTKINFSSLIESAFTAATEHVIQNGFRKCGLFPFEANAIDYAKCMSDASRIIDKPCQFEPQHLLYLESVFPSGRILQFRESGEEWLGDDSAKELFYVWKKIKNIVAPSTGNEGQPATTEQEDHHLVITSTQGTQTSHVNEVTENALCGPEVTPKMFSRASSEISPAFSNSLVWPSESPVKKLNSRKKIKLPDAVGAGEWDKYWKERRETAASKAQKKVEREEKRKKKLEMKNSGVTQKRKVGKKEKEMFISSESEDERELANSLGCKQLLDKMYSSESETDLADLMAPENTGESFEIFDVKATDFILAEFPTEGGSVARYAAQILIVNDDEVQVSCLRRSLKMKGKFIFPVVPDVSTISKTQVKQKLNPIFCGGTKRQQSAVSFDFEIETFQ
ncbi:hypothetical protein ILUMI_23152 [Ignelater luminosus]|uniref:HTH CENPB-type domain-containing protein n=1 Tax=Ignelater luminosus TaxID=2038154 RepID=A0A8K0C9A5_IGNLU|nr:hypothetical protein ILUMI_23152 [Ignelater luminosus]